MKIRKTGRKATCAETHEGSHALAYERGMDVYQCEGCSQVVDARAVRRFLGRPSQHDEDGM